MQQLVCDECAVTLPVNAFQGVSLKAVWSGEREVGDPRDADFCSVSCLRDWIDHEYPVRRPDFGAAHALVRDHARDEDALDESIDSGLLGAPAVDIDDEGDVVGIIEAAAPPVVTVRRVGRRPIPNHGLGGSEAARQLGVGGRI